MVALALVIFLMVLTAFMYVDILGAKMEVKQQLIKLDELRKEISKQVKEP